MNTEIKKCGCESEYQDKKYGLKRRVHNIKANGGSRCVVCGSDNKGDTPVKKNK